MVESLSVHFFQLLGHFVFGLPIGIDYFRGVGLNGIPDQHGALQQRHRRPEILRLHVVDDCLPDDAEIDSVCVKQGSKRQPLLGPQPAGVGGRGANLVGNRFACQAVQGQRKVSLHHPGEVVEADGRCGVGRFVLLRAPDRPAGELGYRLLQQAARHRTKKLKRIRCFECRRAFSARRCPANHASARSVSMTRLVCCCRGRRCLVRMHLRPLLSRCSLPLSKHRLVWLT